MVEFVFCQASPRWWHLDNSSSDCPWAAEHIYWYTLVVFEYLLSVFFLFFLHFACAMFLSVLRWVTVYGYTVLVCSQPLRLTQPQWDGKWVPGKRQWCVSGKVTVGLTSHWLCITDSARYIYLAAYWPEEGIEYSACTSVWHPLHVC